jgi:purine catabolism regulator
VDVIYPSPRTEDSSRIVERLRGALAGAGGGASVAAGIGRNAQGIEAIRLAYRQASMALAIARDLYGGTRSLRFEELGAERLLFHLIGYPELATYRHDMIGPLEDYDRKHGADLTRTVEVFLACHGNHARAARELHLHRNTLLYRLERATELLGKDLDDPETRLAVQLALKVRSISGRAMATATQGTERPGPSSRRAARAQHEGDTSGNG